MNCINFTGNLGGDADIRYTPDGKPITSFSVALSSGFGDKKQTTWMRCTIFGDRGPKLQPYLTKGAQVGITGEFAAREWQDKDGATKTSCEVRVNDVTLLGAKREQPQAKAAAAPQPQADYSDFDDAIPF